MINSKKFILFYALTLLVATAILSPIAAQAQRNDRHRPVQVSLITPISTNWLSSHNTVNNFSLNLLWGKSGGVLGVEFGGLLNQTDGDVLGAQFAGLMNIVNEEVHGAQFGGLMNISAAFDGFQAAGLLNIANPKATAEQTYSQGGQFAGLINIHRGKMRGVQAAGLANISPEDIKGVQMAGLANVNNSNVDGLQIAGIVNKAANIRGVQIALINIADTVQGVSIGLLNFVKDGYKVVELEANESFWYNLNYKIGTEQFYTIFSLAFDEQEGKPFWGPGIGFGTYKPLNHRLGVSLDASAYQVNEDEWWTNKLNLVNKLNLDISYLLWRKVSIYAGASINVKISEIKDAEGLPIGSTFKTPRSIYHRTGKHTNTMVYPGLNLGLRF